MPERDDALAAQLEARWSRLEAAARELRQYDVVETLDGLERRLDAADGDPVRLGPLAEELRRLEEELRQRRERRAPPMYPPGEDWFNCPGDPRC